MKFYKFVGQTLAKSSAYLLDGLATEVGHMEEVCDIDVADLETLSQTLKGLRNTETNLLTELEESNKRCQDLENNLKAQRKKCAELNNTVQELKRKDIENISNHHLLLALLAKVGADPSELHKGYELGIVAFACDEGAPKPVIISGFKCDLKKATAWSPFDRIALIRR